MRWKHPIVALAALAFLSSGSSRADEIAVLPVGDPARALELVSGEAGDLIDLAGAPKDDGSRAKSFDDLVAACAAADVVVVGEIHVQRAGHELQERLVRALASRRPVALGLEFFEDEDDAALARYVAGRTDAETMLDETGWYASGGFPHAPYLALVDACRDAHAPVFGLNVPRSVVRTVSRQGWDALTPEQKERIGPLGDEDPRHRFVVDMMMGGIGSSMGPAFEGMLRGQMTWDAAMARAILRARAGLAKDRLIIAVAGMGHAAHGLAIPARLRAADPALKVLVLNPVVAEKPPENAQSHPGMESTANATMSRGFADWAMVLPDEEGAEERPTFGMTLKEDAGAVKLDAVEDGSPAARAGLKAGDVLTSVAGEPAPKTLAATRWRLSQLGWNERVELGVKRGDRSLVVPVIVVPPVDGPGRWLTSRDASSLLDRFDPLSPAGLVSKPLAGLPQARLVLLGSKPVRLDVLDGSRLLQSWTLDDAARPTLGLLAEPASDGAVRIEIDRDADGRVTAQRRFDASGKPLTAG
jgi:uncharacterized iron-regulated protein